MIHGPQELLWPSVYVAIVDAYAVAQHREDEEKGEKDIRALSRLDWSNSEIRRDRVVLTIVVLVSKAGSNL
jgi:hypothetical protein